MPRCRHDLVPLIEWPTDLEGMFAAGLSGLKGYLLCRRCARVGWYTKHARRLSFLAAEDADNKKQKAREFEQWNRERKAGVPA